MSAGESYPCPRCQIGRLRLRLETYVHVYIDTMVSVPNTPAWKCDFCQSIEYDRTALMRIEALVGQAGPPPNRYRSPAQRQAARDARRLDRRAVKRDRS